MVTHDLTDPLTGTLSGLELGLSISALNRLRRRKEQQMTDARETILWRLATARDRVRKLDAPTDDDELGIWVGGLSRSERSTIATVLADQLALVTDCAAEIRQRDATIAELGARAREGEAAAEIIGARNGESAIRAAQRVASDARMAAVEIAELRGRVAALESMTPGGVR